MFEIQKMTVWGGARNPDLPRSSTAQQYCQADVITNYTTQTVVEIHIGEATF